MQVNRINFVDKYNKNRNISFEAQRVDKGMQRFYEVNASRMPKTLKEYLASLNDRFSITPLQAQKEAFKKLEVAKSIKEIKEEMFPNEELFADLKNIEDTMASRGLLAVFREYKTIFESGILKKAQNFTIYLLKKIFVEAKTVEEINEDLEKDLDEDLKFEFKSRYPQSSYIHSSTLKSLGIHMPDVNFQNSLRFTRDGYSDAFGALISEAQLKYWNSLSEEEKFDILSKRCEGRDNWWNSLSYDEKLEYAAGIDSDDELYDDYKKYVSAEKRRIRKENKSKETTEQAVEQTKKPSKTHIKIGSKLEDKDIFVLWLKKNLENFYARLSEADKDRIHLKRSRRLFARWREMPAEEKTEYINKMRLAHEPIRYVMIDAWNNSEVIMKTLSEFLKSKQILKPIDMLYSSDEFSEFQSKIMTEFWGTHPEFAEMFGENIKAAYRKVEASMQSGMFEDLKKEIIRNKENRVQAWKRQQRQEEYRLKEIERIQNLNSKEKIVILYKKLYGEKLPQEYMNGMIGVLTEILPENILEKYADVISNNAKIPEDLKKVFENLQQNENPKIARMQRSLEAAIAAELTGRGADNFLFSLGVNDLISEYNNLLKQSERQELPPKQRVNRFRVDKLYNEFSKSLSDRELKYIVGSYFSISDGLDEQTRINVRQKLYDYIDTYGRSALIIFSDQSAYSVEQKNSFNNKFMNNMPQEIKKYIQPYFVSEKIISKEQDLQNLEFDFLQEYKFLPKDVLEEYMRYVKYVVRHSNYSIKMIREMLFDSLNLDTIGSGFLEKKQMSYDAKLKLLAIETAMADELDKVLPKVPGQNNNFYGASFEILIQVYKYAEKSYKNLPLASKKRYSQPDAKNVKSRYEEYLLEFKERQAELPENQKLSFESILYTLNPYEKDVLRDKSISISMKNNYGFEE